MKKILALVLDGLGYSTNNESLVKIDQMNNLNKIIKDYPNTKLYINKDNNGKSNNEYKDIEFNYMVIGAGRKIKNKEELVNDFLRKIEYDNKNVIRLLKNNKKDVHIISKCDCDNLDNLLKMYNLLIDNGFNKIHFHLIGSNYDDKKELIKNIGIIKETLKDNKIGNIATISGSKYVLNDTKKWSLTKQYYDLIINGKGTNSLSVEKTIKDSYLNNLDDTEIIPTMMSNNVIKNDDVLIWLNYIEDESHQLLSSICDEDFNEFNTKDLSDLEVYSFYMVDKKLKIHNFLENTELDNSLGVYLSKLNFNQARIAEQPVFHYISHYFDGLYGLKINKCDKFIIDSNISNISNKPEMECIEVTKKTIQAMGNDYDFILTNLSNINVLQTTNDSELISKATIAVDLCLGKIMEKAEENFYSVIIFSSHSNYNDGNKPYLIPFIICDQKVKLKNEGSIINIAPTILDYMDIAKPKEMEETESLLISE